MQCNKLIVPHDLDSRPLIYLQKVDARVDGKARYFVAYLKQWFNTCSSKTSNSIGKATNIELKLISLQYTPPHVIYESLPILIQLRKTVILWYWWYFFSGYVIFKCLTLTVKRNYDIEIRVIPLLCMPHAVS